MMIIVMSPVLTELVMRRDMNCLDRFVGATRVLLVIDTRISIIARAMFGVRVTADSGNIQSLRSTIESLESRRTQLVLLKLDRMDNPAAIGVIDSEIDKVNERLIERTGEYDVLMSTPQRRGGMPGLAWS